MTTPVVPTNHVIEEPEELETISGENIEDRPLLDSARANVVEDVRIEYPRCA
jgi:hypothetical protein